MGKKTPVDIEGKSFSSVNQSRLHYTKILRSYQCGEKLNNVDRDEIAALTSAAPGAIAKEKLFQVTVVKGRFARPCFQIGLPHGENSYRISMLKSIQQHVEKNAQLPLKLSV